MSLIEWLNQYPPFIEEVTEQIQQQLMGNVIAQRTGEGTLEGYITEFTLTTPLKLEFAECVGLTCAIPFRCTGVAIGTGHIEGQEKITFTREGGLFGLVDVAFPEAGWSVEAYLKMYPNIERVVSVESAEFDSP